MIPQSLSFPDTMTAIEITEPGGPEVLRPVERPVPRPGPGELLIAVAAAGVNRPDVFQRRGRYAPPPGITDIPGLEVAGTVAALGAGAGDAGWRVGDRVTALVAGGGYAAYCVAPVPQCLPVPDGLDMIEAAALPENYFTVWSNVFERGRLLPGESLLVHGGASGIGTTAIQLAKAFGSIVFATAGSDDKVEAMAALGADHAINYRTEDFVAVAKARTGGRGIDVVLDMVGGDYVARNIEAMAMDGRHVSIAFLIGATVTLNLTPVMTKRLTLTGSTLRPRSVAEKGAIATQLRERVWPLLESQRIRPVIHATFPLAEAGAAHAAMEAGSHIGKLVLTLA